MKDENKNIDAFFSARLQDETVGEDEWNIPSDDIWNAAKPKFIDRKKPRRRFLIWLLIPLLALCISVPLKVLEGEKVASNEDRQEYLVDKSNVEKSPIQETLSEKSLSENTRKEESGEELTNKSALISKQAGVNKSTQMSKSDIISKDLSSSLDQQSFEKQSQKVLSNLRVSNIASIQKIPQDGESQSTGTIELSTKQIIDSQQIIETKEIREEKINEEKIIIPIIKREELVIPFLKSINTPAQKDLIANTISVDKSLDYPIAVVPYYSTLIIPMVSPFYRSEVGVSHSQLLLNLFLAYDGEIDNGDEINIASNYFNANVTGRKWLSNRWSLMTGVQYSKLDLDLDFSIIDTLDKELLEFINDEFDEIRIRSSISETESDVTIGLKDGAVTQIGDLLNIRGDLRLIANAIQIPLFLDYHIYKKRFEYIFGMGVSLDYVHLSLRQANVEIFKSNELLTEYVDIPPVEEKFFGGSIYAKSGIRYSISKQFNFGLDAKVNLLALPFSGVDLGFYYRWN